MEYYADFSFNWGLGERELIGGFKGEGSQLVQDLPWKIEIN